MAKANKGIKNLKPFEKGEDKRRNLQGRPTRLAQFEKQLGVKFPAGIKLKEVEALISSLMVMSVDELAIVIKDKSSPVVVSIVASSLLQSIKAGKSDELLKLMDRVFGKPTQQIETKDTTPRSRPSITKKITVIKRVVE